MKLNLHLHTNYSDGSNTMREYAIAMKELSHVALVTSDHDYCMTEEKYAAQLIEAKELSKELDFPIICGLGWANIVQGYYSVLMPAGYASI